MAPPSLTMSRLQQALIVLAVLNAAMSSSLLYSVLPPLGRKLAFSESEVGLLITVSALAYAVFAPLWGRVSERSGRVRVLTIGLVGHGLAMGVLAILGLVGLAGILTGVTLYSVLLASRPIDGGLAAAVAPSGQAYVADSSSTSGRAAGMALLGGANGLGVIIGPALGAGLATFGLLMPLWVAMGSALITAAFVIALLPEPRRRVSVERPRLLRLTDPRPRAWLLAVFAVYSVVAIISSTVAFYLQDRLGLDAQTSASTTGVFLLVLGLAIVVVQLGVVRRFGLSAAHLLRVGLPLFAAGAVLYVLADALGVFLGAAALFGGGSAMATSGMRAAASLSVGPDEQGGLAGLTTGAQAIGFVVGPLAAGLLYEAGRILPGVACLALLLVLVVWAWVRRWPDESSS